MKKANEIFVPATEKIHQLATQYPKRIGELNHIFSKLTNIYIDYANVRPWANTLGWHVDEKRLMQLLKSYSTIRSIKLYSGTLYGDEKSESFIKTITELGYEIKTKPVKIMRISIDASSVSPNSPALLQHFIRRAFLNKLDLETIEYLNRKLAELNSKGILDIEDRKCNFDVEIGRDMLLDYSKDGTETFVLWSGDSDFADPIRQLLHDNKEVVLFATSGKVSVELSALRTKGLHIFDIRKIKEFICWKKEMQKGSASGPLSS